MRNKKSAARYGTSKEVSLSKRGKIESRPIEAHNNYIRDQMTDPRRNSEYAPELRASSVNQSKKNVIKLFNNNSSEMTDPQTSRIVHVPPLAKNQDNKIKMNMHRKLVAINN